MKPLTILVASIPSVGHVNSCLGATRSLLERGHRVVFLLEESFCGMAEKHGFKEIVYQKKAKREVKKEKEETPQRASAAGEDLAKSMHQCGIIGPATPTEKMTVFMRMIADSKEDIYGALDAATAPAIASLKPDLIWLDSGLLLPSILLSGLPWVNNLSMTPLFYENENEDEAKHEHLPPGSSGKKAQSKKSLIF